MNCLSCAETLPKRVGVPKITASAQSTSSGVATGMPALSAAWAAHASLEAIAASGASSAALSNRTSAPAFSAVSLISFAILALKPVDE